MRHESYPLQMVQQFDTFYVWHLDIFQKKIYQFLEEYITKRGKKTTENQDRDKREGINSPCRAAAGIDV